MPSTITLTGSGLGIGDVVAVAREEAAVAVDPGAAGRAQASRAAVESALKSGRAVYGVNTGFGKLAHVRIPPDQLLDLQKNLITSHAAGVGDPLPTEMVRAAMLLRANVLLRSTSGVRPIVAERLAALLNARIHPIVPEQGSVGASGDLAPLSHIAMVLMGEGNVEGGREMGAREALAGAGIEPITFQPKEAISFINGTQAQTAVLALLVHDARNLWRSAHAAAAMSLESVRGTPEPFDARIHEARPHQGQLASASLLRDLLADSQIRESHRDNDPRVQDPYSLRCTPQILGPVHDAVEFAARIVETELNASTDNPLVFEDDILSGGNFHGQPVAMALDILTIALATLANISERRIERMVNPDLSYGLPPFLAEQPGLESGYMMVQVTAAALAAETRVLATPASVQTIPTDANQEDVVPMGMAAAFKARRALANARRVVAAELLCGARGLEFLAPLRPGRGVDRVYRRVREVVPRRAAEQPPAPDLEALANLLLREALA